MQLDTGATPPKKTIKRKPIKDIKDYMENITEEESYKTLSNADKDKTLTARNILRQINTK